MRTLILVLCAIMLPLVALSESAASGKSKGSGASAPAKASGSDGAILFFNGTIFIDADTKAQNLLVKDGKVAAWNVQPEKYPAAVKVDLKGAAAYPGFIDSHVHLMECGTIFRVGADLVGCTDVDSMAKRLSEKVKTVPENGVVLGVGFSLQDYDKWSLADLAKIDAVTGNRPAFLVDKLGHNTVINTATMKLAGLTTATPVPLGGKVIVENGKLTGMIRESAMTLPWEAIFARIDAKDIKEGTLQMLKKWASIGYAGAVDLMGAPGLRFMRPDLFMELEKEGTLPMRINYCYTIFDLNDVDKAATYRGRDTDMVRFVGCKLFVDGAFAGGEAWTSWTNEQGNHGLQEVYTDDSHGKEHDINRIVAKVEEYGMNMHYHVQGDMAIGAALGALEKVKAEKGRLSGIHTLIHLGFPTDEQIKKMKQFDGHVVTTVQPGFWPVESDTAHYFGKRAKEAYPIKKLIDGGLSVGMSTDFSVSPLEYAPAAIVMGVAATGGGDPTSHQPVSIRDVIHGLTVGSTRTTGKDDTGKLDVGYKADMVVYDQDLYTLAPEKFTKDNPKVLSTWVGGRKTYEAGK
jgi:predicted amidohydrolase YtcJ